MPITQSRMLDLIDDFERLLAFTTDALQAIRSAAREDGEGATMTSLVLATLHMPHSPRFIIEREHFRKHKYKNTNAAQRQAGARSRAGAHPDRTPTITEIRAAMERQRGEPEYMEFTGELPPEMRGGAAGAHPTPHPKRGPDGALIPEEYALPPGVIIERDNGAADPYAMIGKDLFSELGASQDTSASQATCDDPSVITEK